MSFTIMDSRGKQDWSLVEALRHAEKQAKLTPGVGFYVVETLALVTLQPGQKLPGILVRES